MRFWAVMVAVAASGAWAQEPPTPQLERAEVRAPHGQRPPGYDGDVAPDADGRRRRPPVVVVLRESDAAPRLNTVPAGPPPAAAPASPPPAAEPASPPPPPPAAPRFQPARGLAAPEAVWTEGAPLPAGVPLVSVTDWRAYGLAAPPPGQAYVRIEGTLLLIDQRSRSVVRVPDGG